MATYLRKLRRGDVRNKCPNIRVLQGPTYTGPKMRVYALKRTKMRVSQITLYMPALEVPFDCMAVRV